MARRTTTIMLLIIIFNFAFVALNFADTVYLIDGRIIKGIIIEETDDYVMVFEPDSKWKVAAYWKDIDSIEYGEPNESEGSEEGTESEVSEEPAKK